MDLPATHPVTLLLAEVTDLDRDVPDIASVYQKSWGGIHNQFPLYAACLHSAVKKSLWELQQVENIGTAKIDAFALIRLFAMYTSSAYVMDGKTNGHHAADAGRMNSMIAERLAALAIVRHVRWHHIQVTTDFCTSKLNTVAKIPLQVWQDCRHLVIAAWSSKKSALAAGRIDVCGYCAGFLVRSIV